MPNQLQIFHPKLTVYKNIFFSIGGLKVGIAGLGGLGQMGVLLAKAMGNHVTVISSSSRKIAMAKGQDISDYFFHVFNSSKKT